MGLLLEEKVPDDPEVSAAALRFYYESLCPFELLQRWLCYRNSLSGSETALNDPLFLAKREFCLTCRHNNSKDDEFFMRWQSFDSGSSLRHRLLSLTELSCTKFDIGAVYTLPVSQKEAYHSLFKPQQKELVFDIDMNDYDDVRTCCSDKTVCKKCWQFLAVAVHLLEASLREDFGCHHILWVFSGRRGIHCWVCDTDVRLLPNESRGQLAEYLNICTGSDQQAKKLNLWSRTQHPAVDRAFVIAYRRFHRLLSEQDLFFSGGWGRSNKLLDYLPEARGPAAADGNSSSNSVYTAGSRSSKPKASKRAGVDAALLREQVMEYLKELKEEPHKHPTKHNHKNRSVRLFEKLCQIVNCPTPAAAAADAAAAAANELEAAPNFIKEIVLAVSYPRLDINVSKDIGHLLKAPFCVHQGTGRVCVPVDLSELESFDPQRVPTLSSLRREFDDPSRAALPPKERTSLSPFLRFFESKFLAPLEQTCLEELKCCRYTRNISRMGCCCKRFLLRSFEGESRELLHFAEG